MAHPVYTWVVATEIEVAESADALSHAVAAQFMRLSIAAVRARGRCAVALSGGSTPRGVYRQLAYEPFRSRVPWDQIEFFWGDERHVPVDHPDSNYRMAAETLLSKVPVRSEEIHRVHTEIADAARAAQEYEDEIRLAIGEGDATPRFDLILLGLGTDGHTASLFPDTSALAERQRLCVANWVPALCVHRITMTYPLINAARAVTFVVSGAEKAAIVREALRGRSGAGIETTHASPLPAQVVRPTDGDLWWMLDRAAAGESGETTS
jgi:6-phosphogluconolactonase